MIQRKEKHINITKLENGMTETVFRLQSLFKFEV